MLRRIACRIDSANSPLVRKQIVKPDPRFSLEQIFRLFWQDIHFSCASYIWNFRSNDFVSQIQKRWKLFKNLGCVKIAPWKLHRLGFHNLFSNEWAIDAVKSARYSSKHVGGGDINRGCIRLQNSAPFAIKLCLMTYSLSGWNSRVNHSIN
jgi:hypothetical protein